MSIFNIFKKKPESTTDNYVLEMFCETDKSSAPIVVSASLIILKKYAEKECELTLQWEDDDSCSVSEIFEKDSKYIITRLETV